MTAIVRMLPPESSNAALDEVEIEVVAQRQRGDAVLPQPPATRRIGEGEVDDRVEAAGEGVVDVRAQVGRQHGEAVERLHPLEQVGDLDVGVAVVAVA